MSTKALTVLLALVVMLAVGVVGWDTAYRQVGETQSIVQYAGTSTLAFPQPTSPTLVSIKNLGTAAQTVALWSTAFPGGTDTVVVNGGDVYEYASNVYGMSAIDNQTGTETLQVEASN